MNSGKSSYMMAVGTHLADWPHSCSAEVTPGQAQPGRPQFVAAPSRGLVPEHEHCLRRASPAQPPTRADQAALLPALRPSHPLPRADRVPAAFRSQAATAFGPHLPPPPPPPAHCLARPRLRRCRPRPRNQHRGGGGAAATDRHLSVNRSGIADMYTRTAVATIIVVGRRVTCSRSDPTSSPTCDGNETAVSARLDITAEAVGHSTKGWMESPSPVDPAVRIPPRRPCVEPTEAPGTAAVQPRLQPGQGGSMLKATQIF